MATSTKTGGTGSSGTLTGSAYDWSDIYGGKADVPDPTVSSQQAVAGTQSNLSGISDLASDVNAFNTAETLKATEATTPGYSANMSKWASDITDLLSGKISSGTKYTLAQSAAERGIAGGIAGSQNSDSALLRALGLTSEAQQKEGAAQLASMTGAAVKSPIMDLTSYFTSPSDVSSAQYAANVIASAATPTSAGQAAQSAAQSGVTSGISAAGAAPTTAGTGSTQSIASLLQSILGTGGGGGGGTITGQANQNVEPYDYNQAYANWEEQYGPSSVNQPAVVEPNANVYSDYEGNQFSSYD